MLDFSDVVVLVLSTAGAIAVVWDTTKAILGSRRGDLTIRQTRDWDGRTVRRRSAGTGRLRRPAAKSGIAGGIAVGGIAGSITTDDAMMIHRVVIENAAEDAVQRPAAADADLSADEFDHPSTDDEQLVAEDAADTINATLARMLVRLGPPPLRTDGGGLAPTSSDDDGSTR
ncbi:hypothetical protein FNH09_08360 [Streptomyces adustus]|uniref:Uncharacterized protein n=1 Tax=Streptomyces adustus TaxID=1609272 RepID=A0A5N8V9J6_9ACTN|nr:hypothetical protein [Streptomyces adustus]MPY31312.1 hypothetical protein [Streptomyces adustus]